MPKHDLYFLLLFVVLIQCASGSLERSLALVEQKDVNNSKGFKDAARQLLAGLDTKVNPCEDFYAFACNSIFSNPEYDAPDPANVVLKTVKESLLRMDPTDSKVSQSEKVLLKLAKICTKSLNEQEDHSAEVNAEILGIVGGMPAVVGDNWTRMTGHQMWTALGQLEAKYGIAHLLVSALCPEVINGSYTLCAVQPPIDRANLIRPEFASDLETYRKDLIKLVEDFSRKINLESPDEQKLEAAVTDVLRLEQGMAMASVPAELQRNNLRQYNPYNVTELEKIYPSIMWRAYLEALGLTVKNSTMLVIEHPRYFDFLEVALQGGKWSQQTLLNLVAIRVLQNYNAFIDPAKETIPMQESTAADISTECLGYFVSGMPLVIGYVYVKSVPRDEREAVAKDVRMQINLVIEAFEHMLNSLDWLTPASKRRALEKSGNMWRNIGWPRALYGDFENFETLDNYHRRYLPLLTSELSNWFRAKIAFINAKHLDQFDQIATELRRDDFGLSPAVVNAWYFSVTNSINFAYAFLNPPYYRLDFPQAVNFGGQGSVAGHELGHAFDDSGVQFGAEGRLSDCDWNGCSWMDSNSSEKFAQMAQCVVQQYSQKCCPLKSGNVRCANGVMTQGENLADAAGAKAAYLAYRKFVALHRNGTEEPRLPGLQNYTANQIYWMSYANHWCDGETSIKTLLLDVHAPKECRVNQVLQNVAQFGADFHCTLGAPMRPRKEDRCQVWTVD